MLFFCLQTSSGKERKTKMTDEERVIECQKEIRRLRFVVRSYEDERREFLKWLEKETALPSEKREGLLYAKEHLESLSN